MQALRLEELADELVEQPVGGEGRLALDAVLGAQPLEESVIN